MDLGLRTLHSALPCLPSLIGRGYNGVMEFPRWRRKQSSLDWRSDDEKGSVDTPRYQPKPAANVEAQHDVEDEADHTLADAFSGPQSGPRVAAAQRSLDDALEKWWSDNETPSLAVLRDGLLLLEAGYDLSESHRTLLLRTAIAHQRGILTALGYQNDPERTGLIVAEAMLDPRSPLTSAQVRRLAQEDHRSECWLPYLQEEVAAITAGESSRQQFELMNACTRQTLAALSGADASPGQASSAGRVAAGVVDRGPDPSSRIWIRALLVSLAVLLIVFMLFGQQLRARARDTISIPAGAHSVSDPASASSGAPAGSRQNIVIGAFHIDRHEVTVREYRRCVAAGDCFWPSVPASATRPDYLSNRAYDLHPMISVDLAAATAYCTWAGMRLPTAAEWEVAAAYAPATQRYFLYPWGDRFEPRYANSAASEPDDTQPAGFYHPFGDSSLGAADMAGNVAEWTGTAAPNDGGAHLVKGGSFRDDADALRTDAAQFTADVSAEAWLGFRCAMSRR